MFYMDSFDMEKDNWDLFRIYRNNRGVFFPKEYFANFEDWKRWFQDQMGRYYHDFFVIREDNEQPGFLAAYEYRIYDSNCKVFFYPPEKAGDEARVSLLRDFCKRLFREYPLNKLFMEIISENFNMVEITTKAGFEKEAVLSEYRYYKGKYCDLFILGLQRERA